jgi:hypothetical protein
MLFTNDACPRGITNRPAFLTTDWILGQFSLIKGMERKMYDCETLTSLAYGKSTERGLGIRL